jgi:hypothetical protein
MSGWKFIQSNPWIANAPQEDETYWHNLVDLNAVIGDPEKGMFNKMPWIKGSNFEEELGKFRLPFAEDRGSGKPLRSDAEQKKRDNYRGFTNFLRRTHQQYILEDYTTAHAEEARQLVRGHFDRLRAEGKAIGSTAEDYENIIALDPTLLKDAGIHMYMGYLRDDIDHVKIPVSFFAVERIHNNNHADGKMMGGYATITSYDNHKAMDIIKKRCPKEYTEIENCADEEQRKKIKDKALAGFNNIAAYAMGQLMYTLKNTHHVRWFNLGGSETQELTVGKKLLGAKENPTFWVTAAKGDPATMRSLSVS